MQDFVKKLDFDSDTFENIKKDMNFILQRLISNMQEKECSEGSITLKLDVEFSREYIPNFNPDVSGESREIAKPKFTHKVTSQMQVKGKKEGSLDTEMELFFNPATGQYELRPVADTSQKTIFDSDYGFFGDDPTQKQLGPDIAPDYLHCLVMWLMKQLFLNLRMIAKSQMTMYRTILRSIHQKAHNSLVQMI